MNDIETAAAARVRDEIDPFLRRHGRMGPLQADDRVLFVRAARTGTPSAAEAPVIACVRLDGGDGSFVLRSLLVHPHWRGRGLGARLVRALLAHADLNPGARVYCLAYPDLVDWYGRLGFGPADPVPEPLLLRQYSLRLQGAPTRCLVHILPR